MALAGIESALASIPQVFPTALSPYFAPGGPLEAVNEDVGFTIAFMLCLGVIDTLLVRPLVHAKARYFALHIIANVVSAIAAWPDVRRALLDDPLGAFSGASTTMVANSAVCAIHLYHIVAFPLRGDDIFHHVAFVVTLSGVAIPFKRAGGAANNLGCFFLSGIPGALNYVFLVLYYHGWMTRLQEKTWTARVNVWFRGPAMAVYAFIGAQAMWRGTYDTPAVVLFGVIMLHFTNGQHYAQQSVESLTRYIERVKADGGKEPASPTSPAPSGAAAAGSSKGKKRA